MMQSILFRKIPTNGNHAKIRKVECLVKNLPCNLKTNCQISKKKLCLLGFLHVFVRNISKIIVECVFYVSKVNHLALMVASSATL